MPASKRGSCTFAEGTRSLSPASVPQDSRLITRVVVQARRQHYAQCQLCVCVLSHNRARPRPPARGRHGKRVLQAGAREHEGDGDSMERVAWTRRARRLLMATLLLGFLGLVTGPGVRLASAVEGKSPVMKPVEDPQAGNPDDPEFGPLTRGPRAFANNAVSQNLAEERSQCCVSWRLVLSSLWLHFLQEFPWGQK